MSVHIIHTLSIYVPVDCTYENLVEEFKDAEDDKQCRYAVFDAEYELKDRQKRSKLVFFLW